MQKIVDRLLAKLVANPKFSCKNGSGLEERFRTPSPLGITTL